MNTDSLTPRSKIRRFILVTPALYPGREVSRSKISPGSDIFHKKHDPYTRLGPTTSTRGSGPNQGLVTTVNRLTSPQRPLEPPM